LDAYLALCEAHEKRVKEAFFADTHTINCLDNCMLVGISTLHQLCEIAKARERKHK
jgi:hypothetical protein